MPRNHRDIEGAYLRDIKLLPVGEPLPEISQAIRTGILNLRLPRTTNKSHFELITRTVSNIRGLRTINLTILPPEESPRRRDCIELANIDYDLLRCAFTAVGRRPDALKLVRLRGFDFTPARVTVWKGLQLAAGLECISLSHCAATDECWKILLESLRPLPNLQVLRLRSCGLTAYHMGHITSLLRTATARRDELNWVRGLRGSPRLTTDPRAAGLLVLDLSHNQITDGAIDELKDILDFDQWLFALSLRANALSPAAIRKLHGALVTGESIGIFDLSQQQPSAADSDSELLRGWLPTGWVPPSDYRFVHDWIQAWTLVNNGGPNRAFTMPQTEENTERSLSLHKSDNHPPEAQSAAAARCHGAQTTADSLRVLHAELQQIRQDLYALESAPPAPQSSRRHNHDARTRRHAPMTESQQETPIGATICIAESRNLGSNVVAAVARRLRRVWGRAVRDARVLAQHPYHSHGASH